MMDGRGGCVDGRGQRWEREKVRWMGFMIVLRTMLWLRSGSVMEAGAGGGISEKGRGK